MAQNATQRIEELEAEVAFLKQELGMVRDEHRRARLAAAFKLTPLEADILLLLHDRPRVLSKEAIFSAIWGAESDVEIKIVDVYICKIRRKIGFSIFETIWGQGYRLSPEGAQLVKDHLDKLPN